MVCSLPDTTKKMKRKSIKISGMSCSGCAKMIAENISHLEGVEEVTINLNEASAIVYFDPQKVTDKDFKHTIEMTGYGFEGIK